ncbi:ROK family protein [Actinoplanes sp. N902-109]|uniref:ROK family protein n=1 Tax=Actinoplanes sp. (strain N902-109) TaxID=649831 RepID=UPI000329585E|nr:ROK family protein [Actinoplanes sp. N902-109]AGL19036.1 ROK family protein [Actinoplanes sp. N902-109]
MASTTRRSELPPVVGRRSRDSSSAVLRAILDHGPVARSSVARAAQLSHASVTGIVGSLLERGLVCEVPQAAGPRGMGRPHVPLDIDARSLAVAGVHIAVKQITVALLDLRGRVLARQQRPHGSTEPAAVLRSARELVAGIRRTHGSQRRILGLGLATGGWVDAEAGTVVEHDLLGWREVPAGALLAAATGLPVRLDSNARALLKAEQLVGRVARQARRSAVHLFVGNVVDVAFALGGVVHRGSRSAAGAVAHLPIEGCAEVCACGRTGCLQAAVSQRTLLRRAVAAGLIRRPVFDDLLAAAGSGSAPALELLHERARLVGRAAALLLDLFDPEVLIVTEQGVNRLPGCLATLRAEAGARSAGGSVHPSSFADAVPAVAGGAVALDLVYG